MALKANRSEQTVKHTTQTQVESASLLRRSAKERIRGAQECIKVEFFDKIGHAEPVGFWFYSAI